ncbi:dihydroorotate dehydrogenase [Peribacillus alkalitolerans]|uniref:dihydroorotate dehydrogenase n=1 Tax=Peribacillus alkalitolerans TaxID=1550385 RepID=UPI0013D0E061|nr:dihydroorotate dehydrogenase [Peribacillus alkalitolerans]
MPDWSYHPLFLPFLKKLDAERSRSFIHKSMNSLAGFSIGRKWIEFLGHMKPDKKDTFDLHNWKIHSKVGLSGKLDSRLEGIQAFCNLGFGAIEIGPISLNGNKIDKHVKWSPDKRDIFYFNQRENVSVEYALDKMNAVYHKPVPFFARIVGNETEIVDIAKKVSHSSDFIVIEELFDSVVLDSIKIASNGKPLFLCLPYIEADAFIESIVELYHEQILDGVIIEEARLFQEKDYFSYQSNLEQYSRISKNIKKLTEYKMTVITVGGVTEPKDALMLLQQDVDLVFLSSQYVQAGPGLPKRINEAVKYSIHKEDNNFGTGWKYYLFFGLLILFGGILALLFGSTSVILPYDELFLQMKKEELYLLNERILFFMAHDRITLAGTMISGGILYVFLSKYGVKKGRHWAKKAINIGAITGFLGILAFIGFGYFDWLHGLFWLILFPFYWIGRKKTTSTLFSPSSTNKKNTRSWKASLYGQLCFVILGFALTIGGIMITIIGMTYVFIPTDISYLCMPADQIALLNERLIPVIAHDRAGFGSALISVGLLVLMISLWGFREGEKWVWNALLLGGIPAFLSGISIHFTIGYTSFIHLLPAYFACLLYVLGLTLSFPYLKNSSNTKK